MITVRQWLDEYAEINDRLLGILEKDAGRYSDEKLAALEAALELRQEMLDELAEHDITADDRLTYQEYGPGLKALEVQVEEDVRAMMADIKAEQASLQDKRKELGKLRKANKSYIGMMPSSEGYFIDRKK